jgi:hypothetical protein
MRNIEEPVTVKSSSFCDDYVTSHPSFTQIRASRVSGGAYLYGSDFEHQHYVTVSIKTSELHRGLSRDWHMDRKELIEVAMSESQWATFVSSMNVGGGVPCTMQRLGGEGIPALPKPENLASKFKEEMQATMGEIQSDIEKLIAGVDGYGLSKKKSDELKKQLGILHGRMTGNTTFVASQFEEHVENVIECAKIEVNAYVVNSVTRAGLDKLGTPISLIENT